MEYSIAISMLNDFIFCPASIYFHNLYGNVEKKLYQSTDQVAGSIAHQTIDNATYSTRKEVLQGFDVYCDQYNLTGKVDQFNMKNGELVERKKKIKQVYDGYIFQLYGQTFALREMGYFVQNIALYSMDDNKKFPINLPENDPEMMGKFEHLIEEINLFDLSNYRQENRSKCIRCIYEPICGVSYIKTDMEEKPNVDST